MTSRPRSKPSPTCTREGLEQDSRPARQPGQQDPTTALSNASTIFCSSQVVPVVWRRCLHRVVRVGAPPINGLAGAPIHRKTEIACEELHWPRIKMTLPLRALKTSRGKAYGHNIRMPVAAHQLVFGLISSSVALPPRSSVRTRHYFFAPQPTHQFCRYFWLRQHPRQHPRSRARGSETLISCPVSFRVSGCHKCTSGWFDAYPYSPST